MQTLEVIVVVVFFLFFFFLGGGEAESTYHKLFVSYVLCVCVFTDVLVKVLYKYCWRQEVFSACMRGVYVLQELSSDVVSHQADLRFMSMAVQKYMEEAKVSVFSVVPVTFF